MTKPILLFSSVSQQRFYGADFLRWVSSLKINFVCNFKSHSLSLKFVWCVVKSFGILKQLCHIYSMINTIIKLCGESLSLFRLFFAAYLISSFNWKGSITKRHVSQGNKIKCSLSWMLTDISSRLLVSCGHNVM